MNAAFRRAGLRTGNAAQLASFLGFPGFAGNVTIAAGDFNNDGTAEIVVAAAANGHIKVFNRDATAFTAPGFSNSFLTFDGYIGDVFVAAGDINGDGIADIIAGTGAGTIGHIKDFSGVDGGTIVSYFAFLSSFGPRGQPPIGAASVGVADVNGDGRYEVIVTPNDGGAAVVNSYDLNGLPQKSFQAFPGFTDILTASGIRF